MSLDLEIENIDPCTPKSSYTLPCVVRVCFNISEAEYGKEVRKIYCKGCNGEIKWTVVHGTTNILRHLESSHATHAKLFEEYKLTDAKEKEMKSNKSSKGVRSAKTRAALIVAPAQVSIKDGISPVRKNLFKANDPTRAKVNIVIVKLLVANSLPLALADSPYFRAAFEALDERDFLKCNMEFFKWETKKTYNLD
jgi:hypothetical protein